MAFHANKIDLNGGGASRKSISFCESSKARQAGSLDHQLFVSRYLVARPKPEQLEQLIETDRAEWEQHHPNSSPTEDKP